MENLSNNMSEWAKTQLQLKEYNDKIKILRNQNNDRMNLILTDIEKLNIENNVFQMSSLGVNIKVNKTKQHESISYKYLENCINEYFIENINRDDKYHLDNLLNFIKQKRKTTIKSNLTIID